MKRREFIALLGGAAATWPMAARGQQPAVPVVGVVSGSSAAETADALTEWRRALAGMGFVEGRTVAIEYRWADGKVDQFATMAAELIDRKVSVLQLSGYSPGIRAAKAMTSTIPIVFTSGVDPVAAGLVVSLGRPGQNLTGVTSMGSELVPKRFELLHELLPSATRVALLVNPGNPLTTQDDLRGARDASRRFGLEVIAVEAGNESEIERAFAAAVAQKAGALLVGADAVLLNQREQIAALGLRHALPTMSSNRVATVSGQLLSYGANNSFQYGQAGTYVGRILKGEKPAELPVLQPTKFELIVNLKTAKAIGLAIPETFLLRADEVIE
jgi:putative ABC transport system substrate-binding protein